MSLYNVPKLGAINKNTGEYVFSKLANKKEEYICPDCNKEIILCKGEIRVPYFRHKVDTINPCNYYEKPSESQIHKDAKMLIKSLLDKCILLTFVRNCNFCKKNEEFEIPVITETSSIHMEYRFEYNGPKIADVAYLDDTEILCIFEICNTHKTNCENRPEPWFEIDASTLINLINNNVDLNLSYKIPCIRCEKCEDCISNEKSNIENKEKALNILYNWLKNGNEIKPFIFDCDDFHKIEKNTKSEFINEIYDLIIYLGGSHDKWERYCIKLINDGENPYFMEEKKCVELGIGVYYVDINWILEEKVVPSFINYIVCLDQYCKKEYCESLREIKCCNCDDYGNLWVKRYNKNNQNYKVINVGCLSCNYNSNKDFANCSRCKKITPISVMDTNIIQHPICKGCDIELYKPDCKLIFIDVKFNEKDEIKILGGRFDKYYKKWFVYDNNTNINKILEKWDVWMPY